MNQKEVVRVASTGYQEIDDPIFTLLDEQIQPPAFRSPTPSGLGEPFDLEVARPRAVDIRRLYGLLGQEVPPEITAALGPSSPILLCHGLTPFYKPGQCPIGVWGMGYKITLNRLGGSTVALFPDSDLIEVAKVSQKLRLGVAVGGEISMPIEGLEIVNNIPGFQLAKSMLHATTDQTYGIAIDCSFSVMKIQAGPVGNGGARWNLYRADERIDLHQPLFHSLLVPAGTESIQLTIETWIRRSQRLFRWRSPRQWLYPPIDFDVSLEGLSS